MARIVELILAIVICSELNSCNPLITWIYELLKYRAAGVLGNRPKIEWIGGAFVSATF